MKEHYNLLLSTRQGLAKDFRDTLEISLMLEFDGSNDNRIQLINAATVKIYINESLVTSKSVDIDTTYLNEILLEDYISEFMLDKDEKLHIRATIEFRDKSEYLENTSIEDYFILTTKAKRALFIDLDCKDNETSIFCTVKTTVEPDFLEFKTNFQDWTRISDVKNPAFAVKKEEKPMWIQVRGKLDENYSYSNAVHILI